MGHAQNKDYSQRDYDAIVRDGEELISTHCCFCGMQCGMNIRVNKEDKSVLGVEPRYDFPMNGAGFAPKE